MLKLNSATAPATSAKLPNTTLLGVSWLNGRFSAVALQRGSLGVAWTCPSVVRTPAEFSAALRESVRRTSFQGTQVSLVLLDPQFAQHWVEVPTGRSGQLGKYLHRQVQQHKPFSGAATWAFQLTVPTKVSGGALLHLLPTEFYERIVDACNDAGLHLVTLTGGAEVLRAHLRFLPLRDDEITVVATALGDTTTVLVARGDGMPLLVRTIQGAWKSDAGRVAVDLNRTLLYAQQQFGVTISNVWLSGSDVEEQLPSLSGFFGLPLKASLAPGGEFSWAEEALRLAGETPINLISREHREAPARRTVLRFSSYAAIALLTVSVGLSGFVHYHFREEKQAIMRLGRLEKELQAKHRSLQNYFVELDRKGQFLEMARADQPDPIATWVFGSVSEALPSDLVLTNFTVIAETNQWRVTLSGQVQPNAAESGRDDGRSLGREFARRLSAGPLGLDFDGDQIAPAETATPKSPESPPPAGGLEVSAFNAWTTRLKELANHQPVRTRDFHLQGVMR